MTVTIHLKPGDTLASTLARLRATQAERVLLVVPPELMLGEVDFRVIQRALRQRSMQVALVSQDQRVLSAADNAGISAFRKSESALTAAWRPPIAPSRTRPLPLDAAEVEPPLAPGAYGAQSPSGFRPTGFRRAHSARTATSASLPMLAAAVVISAAALLFALSRLIPEATIYVVPSHEPAAAVVPLVARLDAEADAAAGVVPASALSVQVTGEASGQTTGKRYEPNARATGNVTFRNRSTRSLLVPSGTIVATATGNNASFATRSDAELPAGGQTSVPVDALLPGTEGNARAGTITRVEGPLSSSVLVSNAAPLTGGGAAEVSVVTEADKEQLQATLFEQLKEEAFEALNDRLEAGSFLTAESVEYQVLSPTFTPFVGDVSPELYLSMGVKAVALTVEAGVGDDLALQKLQQQMRPGSRLIADSVRYIPGSVTLDSQSTISFTLTAHGTLLEPVDRTTLRNVVRGLTPDEARQALQQNFALAAPPVIELGPDWMPLFRPKVLPRLPWRIKVVVDWDTAARMAAAT